MTYKDFYDSLPFSHLNQVRERKTMFLIKPEISRHASKNSIYTAPIQESNTFRTRPNFRYSSPKVLVLFPWKELASKEVYWIIQSSRKPDDIVAERNGDTLKIRIRRL